MALLQMPLQVSRMRPHLVGLRMDTAIVHTSVLGPSVIEIPVDRPAARAAGLDEFFGDFVELFGDGGGGQISIGGVFDGGEGQRAPFVESHIAEGCRRALKFVVEFLLEPVEWRGSWLAILCHVGCSRFCMCGGLVIVGRDKYSPGRLLLSGILGEFVGNVEPMVRHAIFSGTTFEVSVYYLCVHFQKLKRVS